VFWKPHGVAHGRFEVRPDLPPELRVAVEPVPIAEIGSYGVVAAVDPSRVQQIFSNIFDNACKHAGPGTVHVQLSRLDDRAVVTVSDEGPGIPPHELDRVFHRFYRVDRSRSEPGTGLGLAISKHLVMLHGGSIRALDRRAGGATIEVRLPIEAAGTGSATF